MSGWGKGAALPRVRARSRPARLGPPAASHAAMIHTHTGLAVADRKAAGPQPTSGGHSETQTRRVCPPSRGKPELTTGCRGQPFPASSITVECGRGIMAQSWLAVSSHAGLAAGVAEETAHEGDATAAAAPAPGAAAVDFEGWRLLCQPQSRQARPPASSFQVRVFPPSRPGGGLPGSCGGGPGRGPASSAGESPTRSHHRHRDWGLGNGQGGPGGRRALKLRPATFGFSALRLALTRNSRLRRSIVSCLGFQV